MKRTASISPVTPTVSALSAIRAGGSAVRRRSPAGSPEQQPGPHSSEQHAEVSERWAAAAQQRQPGCARRRLAQLQHGAHQDSAHQNQRNGPPRRPARPTAAAPESRKPHRVWPKPREINGCSGGAASRARPLSSRRRAGYKAIPATPVPGRKPGGRGLGKLEDWRRAVIAQDAGRRRMPRLQRRKPGRQAVA